MTFKQALLIVSILLLLSSIALADWPTLHADSRHSGSSAGDVPPPFRLRWVRHFKDERLGSSAEPIIAGGLVFIATHSGNVYALSAATGEPAWRFSSGRPFLQAPAASADGRFVVAADTHSVFLLAAANGTLIRTMIRERGGFAAAPVINNGSVFIGSRTGWFFAGKLGEAKPSWAVKFGIPIRQTAAVTDDRVFITTEDLRLHCLEAKTGRLLWTTKPMNGQTVRDSYPVIVGDAGRAAVIVRTNPLLSFSRQIADDRDLLLKNAGVEGRDWKGIDAWTKDRKSLGTPALQNKEQKAISQHLRNNPVAQTFYAFDAATGGELNPSPPPVMWTGGCQGVGPAPAVLPDGRLAVEYRTAYSDWNLGVAPLVGLGLLDLKENRITPCVHDGGMQPPWNTFWGTADEQQNLEMVGGKTLLLIHQSTLAGFDLKTHHLFPIRGERDSWGGYRNLPWAMNEWNGPGRGGVAIDGNRLYWITGSRIECIECGREGADAKDVEIDAADVPASWAQPPEKPDFAAVKVLLTRAVDELISQSWAPLYVEPGLAGRDDFFDESGPAFHALSLAYPHLPPTQQAHVRHWLADQWKQHPPFSKRSRYDSSAGTRREWFPLPNPAVLAGAAGADTGPDPFGNMAVISLYADRCDAWPRVLAAAPQLRQCYDDFSKTAWTLDANKGDLYANRYIASMLAYARIAGKSGDSARAIAARKSAERAIDALPGWWSRAADESAPRTTRNIAELDRFITGGNSLFLAIKPHRAKLALFRDLTPEVAERIRAKVPKSADTVWRNFQLLCPTWDVIGQEPQVHYGENFLDPPDFSMSAFEALAYLCLAPADELSRRVDLPWCKADINYIAKLAMVLDRAANPE
jgi:outer membrane protein assembly factor BamB